MELGGVRSAFEFGEPSRSVLSHPVVVTGSDREHNGLGRTAGKRLQAVAVLLDSNGYGRIEPLVEGIGQLV